MLLSKFNFMTGRPIECCHIISDNVTKALFSFPTAVFRFVKNRGAFASVLLLLAFAHAHAQSPSQSRPPQQQRPPPQQPPPRQQSPRQPQTQARIELAWPTPNRAFFEGRGIEAFIQPTASGAVESGLFGGVRNGGLRFHEGIDLKALARDKNGEPADPIFAVLPGVVRYINLVPGNSEYGRYVVIEHTGATPAVYSLYGHLSAVQPELRAGATVARGQRIATMGRSSSTIAIPKAQAHVHFELGVRLTDNFRPWYDSKKFGSRNMHGIYNGYNLMGFDPLDFFRKWRAGNAAGFQDYFARMQQAVRVRVVTRATPDFVRRYPSLLTKPLPAGAGGALGGWEIACNPTGLPFAWTPLSTMEVIGERAGSVSIVAYDEALIKAWRCRSLVVTSRGVPRPGRDLQDVLDMLFGKAK